MVVLSVVRGRDPSQQARYHLNDICDRHGADFVRSARFEVPRVYSRSS